MTLGEQGTREAIIGVLLEARGRLSPPVRREPTGHAEFVDRHGAAFDVKSFRSDRPRLLGGFDLERSLANITRKLDQHINIIMDTSALTPSDRNRLKAAVVRAGASGQVIWFDYPELEPAIAAMRTALFAFATTTGPNLSCSAPPIVLCSLSPAEERRVALVRTATGDIDVLPAWPGKQLQSSPGARFPPAGLVAAAVQTSGLRGHCIRLLCAPPYSMAGYGQLLADRSGMTVLIPRERVWIHANGVMTCGRNPSDRDGQWQSFHPEVRNVRKR